MTRKLILAFAFATLFVLPAMAQCPDGVCPPRSPSRYAPARPYTYGYGYTYSAPAQVYLLADASGQRWTGTDPAQLTAWVSLKNRELSATRSAIESKLDTPPAPCKCGESCPCCSARHRGEIVPPAPPGPGPAPRPR